MSWHKYLDSVRIKRLDSEKIFSSCLLEESIFAAKEIRDVMLKYPVNMLYNRHKLDKYQNKIAERSLYKCEGKITPSVLNKKKKSRIYVDDTLDLHGMSIKDAYDVFFSFIQNAFLKQYKIVLIITGKGFKNQGKIRKCFFDWINYVEIREVILCCENDVFNDGAFYLTIKKSEKNAL